jgi:gas vesicle protein
MGVTVDAIRARIKRETIEHVREGGRVYVILGTDQGATKRVQDHAQGSDQGSDQQISDEGVDYRDELVEELRDRVRALEEANRENRRIIAALTQRIPQLEAPRDERDARETVSEDDGGTETPAGDTGEPRRSWWRRFFGFE